jgi:hypothetical protein
MGLNDLDLHEDAYRRHYQDQYGVLGDSYDDFAPAYRYGSALASDDRFRDADWDTIEPQVRTDWEDQYPDNTWERFKAAIRHGWERITNTV